MRRSTIVALLLPLFFAAAPARAAAEVERLCDPGNEDCRQILINYIRAEEVGLDVAFWFMEDSWIASEVINRHKAGVPVRVLVDTRANVSTPRNADRLAELKAAGVPMRQKVSSGILHWKMMLFAGQGIVEFSGANFSSDAWLYYGAPTRTTSTRRSTSRATRRSSTVSGRSTTTCGSIRRGTRTTRTSTSRCGARTTSFPRTRS